MWTLKLLKMEAIKKSEELGGSSLIGKCWVIALGIVIGAVITGSIWLPDDPFSDSPDSVESRLIKT